MRVIIVDDEQDARDLLRFQLKAQHPQIVVEAEADTVESAVKAITRFRPDLVFLDIELNPQSGFDVLARFEMPYFFQVIFVTSYSKYARKAFRFAALDFLEKPLNDAELHEALEKAGPQLEDKRFYHHLQVLFDNLNVGTAPFKRIMLPSMGEFALREISKVKYCQADGNYTVFFLYGGEKVSVTKTLRYYANLLKEDGIRQCHASYLVNVAYVRNFESRHPKKGGILNLHDDRNIPVSEKYRTDFLDYLRDSCLS